MRTTTTKIAIALATAAATLGGCVVTPLGPDGRPVVIQPIPANPAVLPGSSQANPAPVTPAASAPAADAAVALTARLYPANNQAVGTGLLTGQVVNYMNGRGEFQLMIDGERLVGEATRVRDAANQGIANAAGARGTQMNCRYQMSTPTRGTGQCVLSNGAQYTLHISG